MGVPSFFRWLSQKFPKIIDNCEGSNREEYNDLNEPNPNGIEYDNFYIDMNGLIHPCFHPQDRQAPDTIEDMMVMLTRYLDYLIDIVRPRKLLYLAVDGVAPRAKMNQQRSRRFKAAKDASDNEKKQELENEKRRLKGEIELPIKRSLDSNCITPGTEFMSIVTQTLKKYIKERMSKSSYWNSIVVILSDAGVPGEGEHKVMDFIRRQKETENYNPNLHHCMYGLDADLIMLSLATHERFFSIIREKVFFDKDKCYICGGIHSPDKCIHKKDIGAMDPIIKPFQFLHCHILRGYLQITLRVEGFEFERCIDDFIFFCFLVGNDFLPHIPSLDIRDGAVDLLMKIYREFLPSGGYITDSGSLIVANAQKFLREVGKQEPALLESKRQKEKGFARRRLDNKIRELNQKQMELSKRGNDIHFLSREEEEKMNQNEEEINLIEEEKMKLKNEFEEEDKKDEIRLGEEGYVERYYNVKFQIDLKKEKEPVKKMVHSYFEGMNWVLGYYYRGCQSWDWYYPYLYAPFAEDLGEYVDSRFEIKFGDSIPFRPFEQLMSVLPPRSKECLPVEFHCLMKSNGSPISEFYPDTFKLDFNGEKVDYKAVVVLSFIDQKKLLQYVEPIEKKLVGEEKRRNKRYGDSFIFIGKDNRNYFNLMQTFKSQCNGIWEVIKKQVSDYVDRDEFIPLTVYKELLTQVNYTANGLSGFIIPVEGMGLNENEYNCFMAGFVNPQYEEGHVFKTRYLEGEEIKLPDLSVRGFSSAPRNYSANYSTNTRKESSGDSFIDERKRRFEEEPIQKRRNEQNTSSDRYVTPFSGNSTNTTANYAPYPTNYQQPNYSCYQPQNTYYPQQSNPYYNQQQRDKQPTNNYNPQQRGGYTPYNQNRQPQQKPRGGNGGSGGFFNYC